MPRDLGDVLHYFLPELAPDEPVDEPNSKQQTDLEAAPVGQDLDGARSERSDRDPLPILGVPIGDRDVVRTALTWNLAVETARLGGRSIVVAPSTDRDTPLWPEPGVGPLGTELILCSARNLDELGRAASELAISSGASAKTGGAVFVRVPSDWLLKERGRPDPIAWWLLLTSPNRPHLTEALDLATAIRRSSPEGEIGVTIHGVSTLDEARCAYLQLNRLCRTRLGFDLSSYGLLVDDLNVYRAIAAQRPIGLVHPQAPATRALMDVARLICEDARGRPRV